MTSPRVQHEINQANNKNNKEKLKMALEFINKVSLTSNCVQCRLEAKVVLEKIEKVGK